MEKTTENEKPFKNTESGAPVVHWDGKFKC